VTKLAAALAFLTLNFYTYHFLATEAVIPQRRTFDAFPREFGEWSAPRRSAMDRP
jgi:hypothetical protein